MSLFENAIGDRCVERPVIGGATRRASVRAGLEAIAAGDGANTILIHDAARPFVDGGVVSRLIAAPENAQGAVRVPSVGDTMLRGGRNIDPTGLFRGEQTHAYP